MSPADINMAKTVLHEIALHAVNLALGLQNLAPPQVAAGTSIQYLKDISLKLEEVCKNIEALQK